MDVGYVAWAVFFSVMGFLIGFSVYMVASELFSFWPHNVKKEGKNDD